MIVLIRAPQGSEVGPVLISWANNQKAQLRIKDDYGDMMMHLKCRGMELYSFGKDHLLCFQPIGVCQMDWY